MPTTPKVSSGFHVPPLDLRTVEVTIIGESPLICHRWSDESKKSMLDKQMKRAKQAKAAKSPEEDCRQSIYPHPQGGYAFPSIAFKSAMVDAAGFVDGLTKVTCRGAFHINGEWVKIEGEPSAREDMVRVGMGVADIRFRAQFTEWRATIRIRFNAGAISSEQLVHLLTLAGFSVGIGDWRPEKNGSFGMFRVATQEDINKEEAPQQ